MMYKKFSDELRKRMTTIRHKHYANDTIFAYLDPGDVDKIEFEVADAFEDVLQALVINTADDHNTKATAQRVAKMFVHEIFRGRYYPPPEVTSFPNAKEYDQIYVSGPMSINSTCAHHFQPITGQAYVGVFPGKLSLIHI